MVMRYGVFLAPFGDLSDPNLVGDLAATAQDKGFDGVFVWAPVALRPAIDSGPPRP